MSESRVVHVEVHGQRYPIRSGLDPAYVAELAAYVDEKMRLAARESPAGDTLKVAVLAALNIADEFFRASDEVQNGHVTLNRRTAALERMLDLALEMDQPRAAAR
jgi:cell division protein ZapA